MHLRFRVNFLSFLSLLMLILMGSSCSVFHTTVKDYPLNKPFVYDNKVTLIGDISKDEKIRLTEELNNYWDDSLKVRKLQQFGIIHKIKNPPAFDSGNINRSINFMNAYLNSQGYYYATYKDTVHIDTMQDQLRAKIDLYINLGKNITIDSVSYDLGDSVLQKLTKENSKETLLKKAHRIPRA